MVQLRALLAIMKDFFGELNGYVVLIAEDSPRSWKGLFFVSFSLLLLIKTTAAGSVSLKIALSSFSFAGVLSGEWVETFFPPPRENKAFIGWHF